LGDYVTFWNLVWN